MSLLVVLLLFLLKYDSLVLGLGIGCVLVFFKVILGFGFYV